MSIDIDRLKIIYQNIHSISELDRKQRFPTDSNRRYFLFYELDTLINIIDLAETNIFKESFIVLRTVFEKFLFFWLMFEGKKYRWTTTYNIIPNKDNTPQDARDNTFQLWKKQKTAGNIKFKDVINIESSKQDKIIVTYEFEGLKNKTNLDDEIIPIYNFILKEYSPDDAHLSSIQNLSENLYPFIISYTENKIKLQKFMYHNFFYIENIIRNLVINNLIDNTKADRIKVHYNFMSKFVHSSIASIDIWLQFNSSTYANYPKINSGIYKELILLYVSRLMYLYLKTYENYYKNDDNQNECKKYESLIEELNVMSNDLWFFDNEPLQYDLNESKMQKQILRQTKISVSNDIHYPKNPLERLNKMRNNLI